MLYQLQKVLDHTLAKVLLHVIEKEKTKPTKASLPRHTASTWQTLGCWVAGPWPPAELLGKDPQATDLGGGEGRGRLTSNLQPLRRPTKAPSTKAKGHPSTKAKGHPGFSKSAGAGSGAPRLLSDHETCERRRSRDGAEKTSAFEISLLVPLVSQPLVSQTKQRKQNRTVRHSRVSVCPCV